MAYNETARTSFEDTDVAQAYRHRPPYARKLYDALYALVPDTRRALDIGCGPGKITHELARTFEHVDAVDPSIEMLKVAASNSAARNVTWLHATAEDVVLTGTYDLVTAGSSIHWVRHEVLFPKLKDLMSYGAVIAIISGDGAHQPPWEREWTQFMIRWFGRIGKKYDPKGFSTEGHIHESWMDIQGRKSFVHSFSQSINGFIECQHSRATWARSKLGPMAFEFDAELAALLKPYSEGGNLLYKVQNELVWGTPRETDT